MNQRNQITLCLGIVWVIASIVIIFIAGITGAFPIKGWVSPEITKNRDFNSTNRGNDGSRAFHISNQLYYVGDAEKFFDSALRMRAKSSLRRSSTEYVVLRDILVYTGYNKSIAEATIRWAFRLLIVAVILIEWRVKVVKAKKKKAEEKDRKE